MTDGNKSKADFNIAVAHKSEGMSEYPNEVVIIPIMNSPIFPGMIAPIILTEDRYTPELDKQMMRSGFVALNLVKFKESNREAHDSSESDGGTTDVRSKDIYRVGVLCKVVKKLKLPDGSVNVLVHGIRRYRATNFTREDDLLVSKVQVFEEKVDADEELDAYTRSVINQVKKLSEINPYFNEEMKLAMLNSPSPGSLADLVAFALSLDIPEAQDFLETLVVKKRFAKLLVYLKREKDVSDIQKKITDEVNDKVNKYQREYYLREQLKVIRSELGMDEDEKTRDIEKIKLSIESAGLPEEARKAADEELERLEMIPDSSPEYNVTRTYLNWLTTLPWNKISEDKINITNCTKILNKDHYGLEKAKERILEFLAVRALRPSYDGTILCLAGPPGVGKTSLGHSIAKSLGRKFYRFSLGGMRDEAEIKGHRRTYVGAMPGKIIQALKRVETSNPVIMLDEIDKMGSSYQGDPASALLEVLDPEQNKTFIDNYLDVPFDLSKVLFIATANNLEGIPEPLLDRMEVIELSGYTLEEKISIARSWVIPKQLKKHGLLPKDLKIPTDMIKSLIADYAREPGVRMMEQFIARLCRRAALEKVKGKKGTTFVVKQKEDIEKILGIPRFTQELAEKALSPGVVYGLAWTAYGGEVLTIETLPLDGRGFKLTGKLGDVMSESANLAYSYVQSLLQDESKKLKAKKSGKVKRAGVPAISKVTPANIPAVGGVATVANSAEPTASDFLSTHQIHLHLPAGAVPKDGPSAGITMALALYGLATGRKVKSNIAMTGELSLTGKVHPVGGIKEKILAAKRAGIKTVLIPYQNEKDLKEVPERHRRGLHFIPVKHFSEVLKAALI